MSLPVRLRSRSAGISAAWRKLTPTYDMQVVDEENVALAFFAEIRALNLTIHRWSWWRGASISQQPFDQVPMVTANQYAVGYEAVDARAGSGRAGFAAHLRRRAAVGGAGRHAVCQPGRCIAERTPRGSVTPPGSRKRT